MKIYFAPVLRRIAFLLLVLPAFHCFAQSNVISLSGTVIDRETFSNLEGVHVYTSGFYGTTTDARGFFSIKVNVGDTLYFSRVDFESSSITLLDTSSFQTVIIPLKSRTIVLDTVRIFSQFVISSMLERKKLKRYDVPGLPRGESIGSPDYKLGLEGAIASPVTALYRMFSASYKQEKKLYYLQLQDSAQAQLEVSARENLFRVLEINETPIPEDQYNDFIKFCGLTKRYVAESSDYELLLTIRGCITDYSARSENKD